MIIIPKDVLDLLRYDENSVSGLVWTQNRFSGKNHNMCKIKEGDPSGTLNSSGYYQTKINGKMYLNHRIIWIKFNGENASVIDHINGIRTDNRIENLRLASVKQNCTNSKIRTTNVSGVTGVFKKSGCNKWIAIIQIDNVRTEIGRFYNFEDAVKCRKDAEILHYGNFIRTKKEDS